jgi:hypothetical protein
VNLRNRTLNRQGSIDPQTTPLLRELAGYVELGMQRKAVAFARRMLKSSRVDPREFEEALHVIWSMDPDIAHTRSMVSKAYGRFKTKEKGALRVSMLSYYCSQEEWEEALPFATRMPRSPIDFIFSLQTFLRLGLEEEAAKLAKKGRRMMSQCKDALDQGYILSGLGQFFAHHGEYQHALAFWRLVPDEVGMGFNKFEMIIQIQVAQVLTETRMGLAELKALLSQGDPDLEISYPGLHKKLLTGIVKNLKKYERHLKQVIPRHLYPDLGLE